MNKKTKAVYFLTVILVLVFGLVSFAAVAKNDNAKSEKSNKSSESQEKNDKDINLKNFEKPNESKGETNAQKHEEKIKNAVENLEQVIVEEKSKGNGKASDQIQQVIQEQEQNQEQTTEAIEQIEERGKIKTFFVGTDYKNLGQLRSSLVHNRNEIRQLTQALGQIQTEESKVQIEAQLQILMQERERIKSVITSNEEGFSLFGWVSRFLNNYEQKPIDSQEEEDLEEEVEDAIENTNIEKEEISEEDAADVPETTTVE